MRKGILVTLGMGIGWMISITIMTVFVPLNFGIDVSIGDIFGTLLLFGFPGFVLFIIAFILALRDDAEQDLFKGSF